MPDEQPYCPDVDALYEERTEVVEPNMEYADDYDYDPEFYDM